MITLAVPLPTFLQQPTIFICLAATVPPPQPLLITIVPIDPEPADGSDAEEDDADGAAAAVAAGMPVRNEEGGAVMPADHEVCFTTITPGRHCWCCWRICDAVLCCGTEGAEEEGTEGEGLQPPAASATVGVMETETIAGLPLGLLEVLLEGMLVVEEEVAEETVEQVPVEGGVRNVRYGSS